MAVRRRGPRTQVGINAEAAWEAVLCVAVGMGIGYYADRWLGTHPILFLFLTLAGCVAGLRRLLRLMSQMPRYMDPKDADDERDSDPE